MTVLISATTTCFIYSKTNFKVSITLAKILTAFLSPPSSPRPFFLSQTSRTYNHLNYNLSSPPILCNDFSPCLIFAYPLQIRFDVIFPLLLWSSSKLGILLSASIVQALFSLFRSSESSCEDGALMHQI